MKPLSSAIAAALILFSAQGVAEQTTQPVVTSCANVVVVPPSQEQPPVLAVISRMRSACPIIINTLCSYCQALITEPDISVISSSSLKYFRHCWR